MATQKQIDKWMAEAQKINDNPEYIREYVRYRQLAKKADQRLVRLEALQYEEHFTGVLKFAYKRAIRDIQKEWGGDRRFNTAPPTNVTEIKAKIRDIENFIHKPTSNKTQIMKIYQKRADTFNDGKVREDGSSVGGFGKELGVTFTWEDIANFYESSVAQRDDIKKASQTVVRAIATLKKASAMRDDEVAKLTKKELDAMTEDEIKAINDVNTYLVRVSDDKVVEEKAKRLLELGIDPKTLKEG